MSTRELKKVTSEDFVRTVEEMTCYELAELIALLEERLKAKRKKAFGRGF